VKRGAFILGLLLGVAALSGYLKAEHAKMNPVRPLIRYQDVLLDVLGEGRTMLARYLWFKMDMMHEQQDDFSVATFKQKEVAPLLRMINYLDPYFTDAYDTLSYELYAGYGQVDKAIELVDEGLRYSPNSYELNFRRAFYAEKKKDYIAAFEYAKRALAADQDETRQLNALRTLYRAALNVRDPKTGVQVLDAMSGLIGKNPYPEQYAKWKKELEAKP